MKRYRIVSTSENTLKHFQDETAFKGPESTRAFTSRLQSQSAIVPIAAKWNSFSACTGTAVADRVLRSRCLCSSYKTNGGHCVLHRH